jgi:hypothetical protein
MSLAPRDHRFYIDLLRRVLTRQLADKVSGESQKNFCNGEIMVEEKKMVEK